MANRAKTTRERPKRSSTNGRQDVLTVEGKDPNMEYRIVNDTPGRVAKLRNMGWEIDEDAVLISAMDDTSESNNRKHVGDGTKAVVMSMPKDWYEAYQKEKQVAADRLEKTAQKVPDNIKGGYGGVKIE